MNASILPAFDTALIDKYLVDEAGRVRPLPAVLWGAVPHDVLRVWAHKNARYGLPSLELIDWLNQQIDGRTALEVGAGMGDLGSCLNIPMTDSAIQTTPVIAAYYHQMGQPTINPPPCVERIDAEAAVRKYKPQVVIASWLTQKWYPGDPDGTGSMHGTDESVILQNCETYIHIGNENSHADKRIRKLPHAVHRFPWLVSRSGDPSKNVIYVWQKTP